MAENSHQVFHANENCSFTLVFLSFNLWFLLVFEHGTFSSRPKVPILTSGNFHWTSGTSAKGNNLEVRLLCFRKAIGNQAYIGFFFWNFWNFQSSGFNSFWIFRETFFGNFRIIYPRIGCLWLNGKFS